MGENFLHIPEHERHHYIKCELCNQYIDCRNLAQVIMHTHQKINFTPNFISSRKLSEPVEYLKGKLEIIPN